VGAVSVPIITRAVWGARHEAGAGPAPLPAREVWLHHSVTAAPDLVGEHAAIRQLEQIGEDRFGRGISYTFAIVPTGNVYEGHGVATLGAHTGGRNSIARAICWVGNYDVNKPTAAMIESTAQLLVDGRRRGWWLAARLNGGHQQAPGASTACPGRNGMAAIGAINVRAAAIDAGQPATDPTPEPTEDTEMLTMIAPGESAVIPLPPGARRVQFALDEAPGGGNVRCAVGWGAGKYRALNSDMNKTAGGFVGWIANGTAVPFTLNEGDEALTVTHVDKAARHPLGVLVTR